MATNTYVALDKITVSGSSTSSVTFSSISSAYTDLVIVSNYAGSVNDVGFFLRVGNSSIDTGTNYSRTALNGNGTTAESTRESSQTGISLAYNYGNSTSIDKPNFQITNLMNYSNTTTNKTILIRSRGTRDNAATDTTAMAGLWRSTSAINVIQIYPVSGNILAGSTFSLYGIAAEGAGYATGGYVTSDSQYYYHTFTSSGTFTPSKALSCDYLVVAGGGGGGGNSGGGGGAGGFRTGTSYSTTSGTNYSITIGAGGAGAASESASGSKGSDSVFATITSTGGGLGAGYVTVGGDGGSGGGGNEVSSTAGGSGNTPSTSPSQGNNGAAGAANRGGGGGGASAAGSGKDGGNGNYTAISGGATTNSGQLSGGNYYFAGGAGAGNYGASGIGGLGGGGTGAAQTGTAQTAGTTNTGGGGGGGGDSARTGRAGGSGIVIVRYAK